MSAVGAKHIRRRDIDSASYSLFPADVHPVMARVYSTRQISSAEELDCSLQRLLPFHDLLGLDQAVPLLAQALREDWRILVVGDFDADGATSTAVAVTALGWMGARQVDFLVPNRFTYGYGLTPEIVELAKTLTPDLIVTVDNGISSIEGVAAASAAGIRVLVTDHHLPGKALPAADAIVNPNQPGDSFPSKNLAGVGVIFYVMLALRAHLRDAGWFSERQLAQPNLGRLLDLVALGTVADVVPLDRNNRILVQQGIARLRAGSGCAGILALLEIAGRPRERAVAGDLGFALGPRLNAAGRLQDMSLGIRCLLASSMAEARLLAAELDVLNKERREIEREMQTQALGALASMELDPAQLPIGLCLHDPAWHEGVIGILASRIKDRLHRPVIVFTHAGQDELKGSARSIPGLHIRDALDAIAARHPGLVRKFGGHAMAAGLTLMREDYTRFRHAFDEEVCRHLEASALERVVLSDGDLQPEEMDLRLAELVREGGPWGQGFPEPLFDSVFEIVQQRVVGERHVKLQLARPGSRLRLDAIAFNADLEFWEQVDGSVRLVYRLDINEYREQQRLQLIVEHQELA